ncbi:MAG: arylsulfotransferase family protein [Ignavibacteriaceae bacterium]|nr:arylsulfotransferase family protein [Ignavibacteriaceae bacterium]
MNRINKIFLILVLLFNTNLILAQLNVYHNNYILDSTYTIYKSHNSNGQNNNINQRTIIPKTLAGSIPDTSLPYYLPLVSINSSGTPSPGYYFISPSPYLEILDNQGTPVFYRNVGGSVYDFDLQPDGELTYFIYPVNCYGLDSSFNLVRSFNTSDGYGVDVHELRVLPNGSYYIFGKKVDTLDMSRIVQGGNPNALIIDGALMGYDSSGNLIFEWDALNHYNITDVDEGVDLTQPEIDFNHFNAVEFDKDGNFLISARNLDEITKVNQRTGDIIWRMGGRNNQFTFINDTLGFSRQHDIRRLSNGDISIFDNGDFHPDQLSSVVEYKLDEVNKTATLVNRIYYDNIYTMTEGSVEELPGGNKIISWGQNWSPFLTEIAPDNSVVLDLSYQNFTDTYRAFKYPWKTNLFTTNSDSLNFGMVTLGNSLSKQITVYNLHDSLVTINEFFCSDSSFTTNIRVPVTILPKDSLVVPVTFKPSRIGAFQVSFNLRCIGQYNDDKQMIARQVILSGTTNDVASLNSGVSVLDQFSLSQNYPNPFNPTTVIHYEIAADALVTLKIYDELGREVKTLVNQYQNKGKYDINFIAVNLSSGIYFYQLKTGNFISTKKMLLMK